MPRIDSRPATQASINGMVKRIVKKFQPEQVILFDSHARGHPLGDIAVRVVEPEAVAQVSNVFLEKQP